MITSTIEGERALTQRRNALVRANAVRSEQAHLKRQVKALGKIQGPRMMAALIETGAPALGGMRVIDGLLAVPGIGRDRARRIMRLTNVPPLMRLRTVSWRGRQALASELRRIARHVEEAHGELAQ